MTPFLGAFQTTRASNHFQAEVFRNWGAFEFFSIIEQKLVN